MCGKCIRADHELVVVGAIDYNLRGIPNRGPAPSTIEALEHSQCTFCGTCVSMCPTGCLEPGGRIAFKGTPERETLSICGFCPVGCTLSMGDCRRPGGGRSTRPTQPETVNRATLCVRGHFAHDYLDSKEPPDPTPDPQKRARWRRHPGTRPSTPWPSASWPPSGNTGRGAWPSGARPRCTNEENYLFQKIARDPAGHPQHRQQRSRGRPTPLPGGSMHAPAGDTATMPLADLAAGRRHFNGRRRPGPDTCR
jgi:formate dehydrogenase (NADP+) alpha subunit